MKNLYFVIIFLLITPICLSQKKFINHSNLSEIQKVSETQKLSLHEKKNRFENGLLTIDTNFTTGQISETVNAIHNNYSEILRLILSEGTLDSTDVFWIRDNLTQLETLYVINNAGFANNEIPENAFKNHENLGNVDVSTATTIGKSAFQSCEKLMEFKIFEAEYIADSALAGCTALWRLHVNETKIPIIGSGVFEACHFYRQIRLIYEGKTLFMSANDGNTSDNYWHGFELLVPNEFQVTIKNGFTTGHLSDIVKLHRNNLLLIEKLQITKGTLNNEDVYWIRDNLLNLEFLAINGDAGFVDDKLPDAAFKGHKNLKYTNVTTAATVGKSAFEDCHNLLSVSVSSASALGDHAFKGCNSCWLIYVNPFNPPTFGTGTFEGCTAKNKTIDLYYTSGQNCNPDAYKNANDGNSADNNWYGWKIKACSSTVIYVYTDEGGNMDWGIPAMWDTIYVNINGAAFWNGEDWLVNDTYGHMYFCDLRFGGIRIGNYGGINYSIPKETTINNGRFIYGYSIEAEEYSYQVEAADKGTFTYTGTKYRIIQPDSTTIFAYSRGNGNGTNNAYFDIVLEDTSPGPGITIFSEGGVVSNASGMVPEDAINIPLNDSSVMGRLVTTDTTGNHNMYYFDINGGDEMGGMSYIMTTRLLAEPKVVQSYSEAQTYISDFKVHFKNDVGQLESFFITPHLITETYSPQIVQGLSNQNKSTKFILFPNPAKEKLKVQNTEFSTQSAIFEIYDLEGKKQIEKYITTGTETIEIDVSSLKTGVYFCRIIMDKEIVTKKIIIQK